MNEKWEIFKIRLLGLALIVFFGGGAYFTSSEIGVIIIGIIFTILGCLFLFYPSSKIIELLKKKQENSPKFLYRKALSGTDKSEALRLGRIYYSSLREDGKLTIYDEQAITNDLNSMINTVNIINTVIHSTDNQDLSLNSSNPNQTKLFCSKCGKAYLQDGNKKFCEECGNKF